jgi:hypothetical protein
MFKYMDQPSSSSPQSTGTNVSFNIPPNRTIRQNVIETNSKLKRKNLEEEFNNLLKRLKNIDNELRKLETENPQLLRNPNYVNPSAIINYRLLKEKKRAKRLKEEQNIRNFNPNNLFQ